MTPLGFSNRALSSANEACCQTPNERALVESAAMDGRVGLRAGEKRRCLAHNRNREAIMEDRKNSGASAVPVRIERP